MRAALASMAASDSAGHFKALVLVLVLAVMVAEVVVFMKRIITK